VGVVAASAVDNCLENSFGVGADDVGESKSWPTRSMDKELYVLLKQLESIEACLIIGDGGTAEAG
jgi:hypothetical protein